MASHFKPSRRDFLSGAAVGAFVPAYTGAIGSSDGPLPQVGLMAATGSGLVGHIGAGKSAISRPVQAVLREHISVKDNGVAGGGAADDYSALASVMTDYEGREIRFPAGSYVTRTALVPGTNSVIVGEGPGSIIKTDTASNHVFFVTASDVALHELKITGTNGSDVVNNSAVKIQSVARTRIEHVEASGMSGSAFYLTGGSSYGFLSRLYVHDLVGKLANASDVMLYNGAHKHTVTNSVLTGGRTVGVYCQINSTEHKITFNHIDGQTIYGVLDYDTTPRDTYTLILGNSIANISGAEHIAGDARGGAGIYTADTGGQIIANNHVFNTNIDTAIETLIPAGIGVNGMHSIAPLLITGNYVHHNNWYGIMLGFNAQPSPVIGNVIFENRKDQLYFKSCDNAVAVANAITGLAASRIQGRCISVNVSHAGKTGALILGNRTQGGGIAAIDARNTSQSLFVGNNISDCPARGLQLVAAADQVVSGNMIDVSEGAGIAVNLVDVTYSSLSNMVLRIGGGAKIALATSGTCIGTRIDKSVIVSGKANPMDFIDNAGTGCIVEQWGTGAPTLLAHKVGDTVWNVAPAVGRPIGWKCTAAGIPGTWVAMAIL
jgi:hypothetical protein